YSLRTVKVRFDAGKGNEAIRIARGHVADTANCDNNGIVRCTQHVLHVFKRRQLLEQLGLGIAAEFPQSRGSNLKMKGPSIGRLPFRQQRGALKAGEGTWRK